MLSGGARSQKLSIQLSAKALAEFDAETWRTIAWCEGTNTELNSRFAAVHLRPGSRGHNRPEAHAECGS